MRTSRAPLAPSGTRKEVPHPILPGGGPPLRAPSNEAISRRLHPDPVALALAHLRRSAKLNRDVLGRRVHLQTDAPGPLNHPPVYAGVVDTVPGVLAYPVTGRSGMERCRNPALRSDVERHPRRRWTRTRPGRRRRSPCTNHRRPRMERSDRRVRCCQVAPTSAPSGCPSAVS
jgi:hypothetical protein